MVPELHAPQTGHRKQITDVAEVQLKFLIRMQVAEALVQTPVTELLTDGLELVLPLWTVTPIPADKQALVQELITGTILQTRTAIARINEAIHTSKEVTARTKEVRVHPVQGPLIQQEVVAQAEVVAEQEAAEAAQDHLQDREGGETRKAEK